MIWIVAITAVLAPVASYLIARPARTLDDALLRRVRDHRGA